MILGVVAIIGGVIYFMYSEDKMSREDAERDYKSRVAMGEDPAYVAWSINHAVDDTRSLEKANRAYKKGKL